MEILQKYQILLEKWQKTVNLVGPRTLADFWRRHALDSAQLWPLVAEAIAGRPAPVLADLGSGGGFPGLVLAIMAARADAGLAVHLIESDQRKAAFLREVAHATATPVTVHAARAESLAGTLRADVVTARAVAPLAALLALAVPLLKSDGTALLLKGAGVEGELTRARETWTMAVERIPSRSARDGTVLRIRHAHASD